MTLPRPDLSPPDEGASWITAASWRDSPDSGLPVVGTVVHVDEAPASAILRICGLGVFAASIDGRPVSIDVLEPGYTDYAQRAEYCTYDVTELITGEDNVLLIELGPGMYRSQRLDDRWTKIRTAYGDLAACATLTITTADGTEHRIRTDTGWTGTTGRTRSSNWTGGEDFDATIVLDTSPTGVRAWPAAVVADTPPGLTLSPKTVPPLRVREVITAQEISRVGPRTQVVDLGENVAGWPEIELPAHAEVRLRPAELVHADGTVDPRSEGWDPVYHTIRTGSEPLVWHPRFCYNGLRYLEVDGLEQPLRRDQVRALVIAADATATGSFDCSDPTVDQVHRIIHRSIASNMYSVFTDCPHREKLGFLDEIHLVYPTLQWNHDIKALGANTARLIREAQYDDGHLPLYVPEWNRWDDPWRGDVNWGGAIVHLPWQLHRSYDDVSILRDNYPAMTRYAEHLLSARVDGLINYGLGDWDGAQPIAVPFVATASLARMLAVLSEVAAELDRDADALSWQQSADEVIKTARTAFLTPERVGSGTIGETAIGIHTGVVPAEDASAVVDRLVDQIADQDFALHVGEVGMPALIAVLADHDRHDTLLRIVRQSEQPGYGYLVRLGATSLTETWDGPASGISQNHIIHGAIDGWFYSHLAGLQQTERSRGFRELTVRPRPCADLRWAGAEHLTPRGRFAGHWRIDEDGVFRLRVDVPAGSDCAVELPDGTVHRVGGGRHDFDSPPAPDVRRDEG